MSTGLMFRKGIFTVCINTCANLNFVSHTIRHVVMAQLEECVILGPSVSIFLAYFGSNTVI